MSNKTPFELRAEILSMAKDHLQQQYDANLTFMNLLWQKTLESLTPPKFETVEELIQFNQDMYAKYSQLLATMARAPTIEEITKKAAELYSFVQKKE